MFIKSSSSMLLQSCSSESLIMIVNICYTGAKTKKLPPSHFWISNFWIPEVIEGRRPHAFSNIFGIAHTCLETERKGLNSKGTM
jgi:hypothetical protein